MNSLVCLFSRNLDKKIDQAAIERWSATLWNRSRPVVSKQSKPYVVMFPPPNVTGSLHLGHALTGAIQDALVRQKRMRGHSCYFVPGFDHAGLATQNIVEKLLWNKENISRTQLGRKGFVRLVGEWKEEKRDEMRGQLKRLGLDLNFEREYFTMDKNSSQAVHVAFKRLFEQGIIYRSEKLVYWSNELQTTLSDIEVEQIDGVNKYVRTGEVLEKRPIRQWFVDAGELARRSVEVVDRGDIEIIPTNYKRSWSSWLLKNGTHDWCISRQSWWGHRIPAYKIDSSADVGENWVVADNHDEAKLLLNDDRDALQDPDVLDTWFSSSLLPLIISGWPDDEKFAHNCQTGAFPLPIMETGFDILTFWVSKMVMMSLALTNKLPFKMVLLHGMICDSDGKKMSKSRGNVIDPLDVIDGASLDQLQGRVLKSFSQGLLESTNLESVLGNQRRLFPSGIPPCGADGLRAYLLSNDFQQEVVRVRIEQIEKIRRLSNKIWNVFRFFLMVTEKGIRPEIRHLSIKNLDVEKLDTRDKNILILMSKCVSISNRCFDETYALHHSFNSLELFWTVHLSQNYIENVRDILCGKSGTEQEFKLKLHILGTCIMDGTKLLHPFMPHLTEFLYQKLLFSFQQDQSNPSDAQFKMLSYEQYPSLDDWSVFDIPKTQSNKLSLV